MFNIFTKGGRQRAALLSALEAGRLEDARLLSTQQIIPDTAVLMAAINSHDEAVITALLKRCESKRLDGAKRSPFALAVILSPKSVIEQVISKGADVNKMLGAVSPVGVAASFANYEAVELLLQCGADPNQESDAGVNALGGALGALLRTSIVPAIEEQGGTDINFASDLSLLSDKSKKLLQERWHDKNVPARIVRRLLDAGVNARTVVDFPDITDPLSAVVAFGSRYWDLFALTVCKKDDGHGVPDNVVDRMWQTDSTPEIELVERVIAAGADLRGENKSMTWVFGLFVYTAMHAAVTAGNLEVVKLLLRQKVRMDCPSPGVQWMPLHTAVCVSPLEVIEELLRHGADPNAPDVDGRTPLHLAAYASRKDVIVSLTAHGAERRKRDKFNLRPFDTCDFAPQEFAAAWHELNLPRHWRRLSVERNLCKELLLEGA